MAETRANHYLGIDPGKSGGYCLMGPSGQVILSAPLPYLADDLQVRDILDSVFSEAPGPVHCAIEKVSSRPGQGVSSVFRFGFDTGMLHGMARIAGWKIFTPTPQKWQQVSGGPTGGDKEVTAAWVARTYPEVPIVMPRCRKFHEGVTDAIGIAHWLWRSMRQVEK